MAKTPDSRTANAFWENRLITPIRQGAMRYAFMEPLPENLNQLVDAEFGVPPLCDIAKDRWELLHRQQIAIDTLNTTGLHADALNHPHYLYRVGEPQMRDVALIMPGFRVYTRLETMYPAYGPPSTQHPSNMGIEKWCDPSIKLTHVRSSKRAQERPPEQRERLNEFSAWCRRVMERQAEAEYAAGMVELAFTRASGSVRAAITALPGLDSIIESLRLLDYEGARLPYRGHDTFSYNSLRARYPHFSAEWGEVRATLVKMCLLYNKHREQLLDQVPMYIAKDHDA